MSCTKYVNFPLLEADALLATDAGTWFSFFASMHISQFGNFGVQYTDGLEVVLACHNAGLWVQHTAQMLAMQICGSLVQIYLVMSHVTSKLIILSR